MTAVPSTSMTGTRPLWWGFVPYMVLSLVHVASLAIDVVAVAEPSKLLLMPALALALLWGGTHSGYRAGSVLLLVAILSSWLGDGAGSFFPFAPTLPLMLLFFAVGHLCYMRAFWQYLSFRGLPRWALAYALWWVVLLVYLWPRAGGLALAVAAYGLVLGGTAVLATRCHRVIICGSVLFLASDTILAFRIFALELMPAWTSPLVMLTYTLGQGLIIAGALITLRTRSR